MVFYDGYDYGDYPDTDHEVELGFTTERTVSKDSRFNDCCLDKDYLGNYDEKEI